VISEVEDAIKEMERAVGILRRSSCDRWADEVAALLDDVRSESGFAQRQALFRIGELCHPKALGDVFVTVTDWPLQLERLHDSCARAFNRLQKEV
jgi:hypothetical protein